MWHYMSTAMESVVCTVASKCQKRTTKHLTVGITRINTRGNVYSDFYLQLA